MMKKEKSSDISSKGNKFQPLKATVNKDPTASHLLFYIPITGFFFLTDLSKCECVCACAHVQWGERFGRDIKRCSLKGIGQWEWLVYVQSLVNPMIMARRSIATPTMDCAFAIRIYVWTVHTFCFPQEHACRNSWDCLHIRDYGNQSRVSKSEQRQS